jgi:hypothetical protein
MLTIDALGFLSRIYLPVYESSKNAISESGIYKIKLTTPTIATTPI